MDNTKIGIIGLGPVGIILAIHLQEGGGDVAICDADKVKVNQIRKDGVALTGEIEKKVFFKNVYTSVSELRAFKPEVIIVASKTYHTPQIISDLLPIKNEVSAIVCAQNGIDVEKIITNEFGESKVLRMVINFAGNLNAPNVVKVTFFNPPNYIASVDDSNKTIANDIAELLNKVNLTTQVETSFDLLKRVWEKTILNSSLSALCGIGKFTIKEAMDMPGTVEITEQVIEEAVEVAGAEKIIFEDDFIRKCLRYLKKAGNHFPSLAVDLINNRQTEIDFLNGKIVEYGRKHYIRTSLNLAFTNIIKSITYKNIVEAKAEMKKNMPTVTSIHNNEIIKQTPCFLGIDLGSAYTKITVIDDHAHIVFQTSLKTINREKISLKHVLETIHNEYKIKHSCATGYGRRNFADSDIIKTEINCAAVGVSKYISGKKNIIDIGGEDIKIIKCDENNQVEHFHLNDKCAAGTGAFIVEIAERAEIDIKDMSKLAQQSSFNKELNSFCTVFAKTEIMSWLFNGVTIPDIAKGIYLSIANRITKLKIDPNNKTFIIGGVIAYHLFLKKILEQNYKQEISIIENPQYVVSYGAALIAIQHFHQLKKTLKQSELSTI